MKTLNLTFKGSRGKKHLLKLSYASENLTAETVRQAMSQLSSVNAFTNKEGENIYETPLSAKYVDTVSTVLFNDEHPAA